MGTQAESEKEMKIQEKHKAEWERSRGGSRNQEKGVKETSQGAGPAEWELGQGTRRWIEATTEGISSGGSCYQVAPTPSSPCLLFLSHSPFSHFLFIPKSQGSRASHHTC